MIKRHWLAIGVSISIGAIYFVPHIWFITVESESYQGIPLMQTASEDFYISRMQEILDGHWLTGSTVFFEYKDQAPTQPPTNEFFYTLPSLAFGVPLMATLTASRFLLPAILSLLVYFLIYRMLGSDDKARCITALAGALLVTLGYDLIDFRTAWMYLTGAAKPSSFLIWTRPVHPVTGAILLFAFLNFIWSIVENLQPRKIHIWGAGAMLAWMFMSYFFSWGLALSVLTMLGVVFVFRRDYLKVRSLVWVFLAGLFLSSPYWYLSFVARQSSWYEESLLRTGLFYTHYPVFNKVLIAVLALYIIYLAVKVFRDRTQLESRDYFILALLAGGLFAFNQQVITGMTVWPFHFVQYTIPLSIVAAVVVLHNMFASRRVFWVASCVLIMTASLVFGVFTQYHAYAAGVVEQSRKIQNYKLALDWLNGQEKDCVALVNADIRKFIEFTGMVVAFTHCNVYGNSWSYSLMPQDRIYHTYLVNLRFRGISGEEIEEYLRKDSLTKIDAQTYLSSSWAGLYDVARFPDFTDTVLSQRLARLPEDYREFLKRDFRLELDKYKLDYILSFGPLPAGVQQQLSGPELLEEENGIFIYKY